MQIPIHPFGLGLLPGLLEEIKLPQGFPLRLHWDCSVSTGGIDRDMAQPLLHDRHIDTGKTQMSCRGVPPCMNGMNLFAFNAWRLVSRLRYVLVAEVVETGARQASTALIDKKKVPERRQGTRRSDFK
jgi:hypothetical protein